MTFIVLDYTAIEFEAKILIRFGVHIKFSIITTSFVFHIAGNVEQTDQDEDTGM